MGLKRKYNSFRSEFPAIFFQKDIYEMYLYVRFFIISTFKLKLKDAMLWNSFI